MSSTNQAEDTSPTDPSDKFPNRNIKQRLNLHVKRRLQENLNEPIPTAHNQSAFTSHVIPTTTSKRGAASERGATSHCGRGGKKARNTKQQLTTSSSFTSSSCPDDDCSRDGSSSCTDLSRDKDQSPDILTMVLNQKKLTLFNDPEVMKFLDGIVGIIGKKSDESGCV